MDDLNKEFYTAIEKLVTAISTLNDLFIKDKDIFIKNNIQEINDSNFRKSELLKELDNQIAQLQSLLPKANHGEKMSISEYIKQLDSSNASRVNALINKLYASLSQGYQNLVNNNHVIADNLGFLNSLWDRLARIAKQDSGIYTKPEMK